MNNKVSNIVVLLSFVLFVVSLTSCGYKDEKELEKEQSSGVVLVQNNGFYEVELSNGNKLYFSSFDEKEGIKGLAFDRDSVEVMSSYGTGFFVDQEGRIATNAHVVSSTLNDKDIQNSVKDIIDGLKLMLELEYDSKVEDLEKIDYAYMYANYDSDVSYYDFYQIQQIRENAMAELEEMKSAYAELNNIRVYDSQIRFHNEVSIAYNNNHVTKPSDFVECVILKKDTDHDLALLQLKDKKTPAEKYVFALSDTDPFEEYSWVDKVTGKIHGDKNEKLYLHGFNLGPTLGITDEGLQAQFTSGSVSQHTGDRLMYTIPALPGSSGSPIVNRNGEVVAINYAGLNGTQNFNYGVRVKHLNALLK